MAKLVKGGALSHSPLMNFPPLPGDEAKIDAFKQSALAMGEEIKAERPDVLVVIAQDHFRTFFYDLMPAITIGTGRISGWGDWKTVKGELRGQVDLARSIHRYFLASEIDAACSYDLLLDHGITQPVELLGFDSSIPIIPILINTSATPLPSPRRCYRFGQAIREAIKAFPGDLRVAVIGSGGLSHRPPSGNVESTDENDVAAVQNLIHGRQDVEKNEEARQERLIAAVKAGKFVDSINPSWDEMVLKSFQSGHSEALANRLNEESISTTGGSGGQEVRTWLAASGAYSGSPAVVLHYRPIDSLITGMGVISFTN